MEIKESIFWNLVRILWQKKYVFIITVFSVALITFIITSLMAKTYKATLTFIVNEDQGGLNISSLISDLPFDIGGMGSTNVDKYIAMLKSRRVKDALIKKFDLWKEYGAEYIELLYKEIDNNIEIQDNMDGTITINCYFKRHPEKAAEMVQTMYDELYSFSLELNKEKSKDYREFLEKNLNETYKLLSLYEDSLKDFQIKNKVIQFDEQAKFSFTALAELESKSMLYKIEYDVLKKSVSANNPKLNELEAKYKAIQNKMNYLYKNGEDYVMAFNKMPEYGLIYYRLLRKVTIQQEVLKILFPMVQNSRIEEKKETVNIQIIDPPFIPQYKTKPKRLTYMIIFTFLAVFLEILYFAFNETFQKNKVEIKKWINK